MSVRARSGSVLLAVGEYLYYENDQLCNIREPWSLWRGDDDELIVASQRRVEEAGIVVDVEVVSIGGRCRRAEFSWRQKGAKRHAVYHFDAGLLSEWVLNGVAQPPLAEPFDHFFPLMRVFAGPLLSYLSRGGPRNVLVPWIKDPGQIDRLFGADISEREAKLVASIDMANGQAQMLEYNGGQYEQAANCVVAEGNWLQAYSWQMCANSRWEVRLATPLPAIPCPDFTVV